MATARGARVSPLPPWRRSDLPHPPAFTLGNAVRVIGPGTLLLGVSLGAGDWLLGPAVTVTYGAALLWLCTMSVILQAVLNTEMARYTLATGEPIFTGFMRTPPGAPFWGWSYSLLHLAQVAWPGWALAAGSALAALSLGRMPRADDHEVVLTLGYLVFLGSIGIVLLGGRVQRRVERAELIWEKGTNRSRFFRGEVDKYTWVDLGSSYLPGEITAAFLWAQLEEAESITRARLALWQRYYDACGLLVEMGVELPTVPGDRQHNAHLFRVLLPESVPQADVLADLKQRGIHALFHYVPLHSSPAGQRFGRAPFPLPVTDSVSRRIVRLPLWLGMRDSDPAFIADQLAQAIATRV